MSDFLGWAYIVVGGLCIVLGLISATAESFKTRFVQSFERKYPHSTAAENFIPR